MDTSLARNNNQCRVGGLQFISENPNCLFIKNYFNSLLFILGEIEQERYLEAGIICLVLLLSYYLLTFLNSTFKNFNLKI